MIILIAGSTHTGKTVFAQKLMETYSYPYLSIDHLKMGLIRSGRTLLTPGSDGRLLTDYLWPVVREMIKTAIENKQNLIVEGCYIPFDFQKDFEPEYLREIRYVWLIFSENYIRTHFADIRAHGSDIEDRMEDEYLELEPLVDENRSNLEQCRAHGLEYVLIDETYEITWRPQPSAAVMQPYPQKQPDTQIQPNPPKQPETPKQFEIPLE